MEETAAEETAVEETAVEETVMEGTGGGGVERDDAVPGRVGLVFSLCPSAPSTRRLDCELNELVKRRTHPMDILEEWTHDPVLESVFVEISPVNSHRAILREVMNAMIIKSVGNTKVSIEDLTYAEKYGLPPAGSGAATRRVA